MKEEESNNGPFKLRGATTLDNRALGGILFAVSFVSATLSNDFVSPVIGYLESRAPEIEAVQSEVTLLSSTQAEHGQRIAHLEDNGRHSDPMVRLREAALQKHVQDSERRQKAAEGNAGILDARVRHIEHELDLLVQKVR